MILMLLSLRLLLQVTQLVVSALVIDMTAGVQPWKDCAAQNLVCHVFFIREHTTQDETIKLYVYTD